MLLQISLAKAQNLPASSAPRPSSPMDNVVSVKAVQIERKHFTIEYCENARGRFLRIVEEAHGRRNTIIVPSTGLEEFTKAVAEVLSVI